MKILVTGDAGFVGRYFHKALDGHDITGIDIKNGIDARKFFTTDETCFDLVVHLAAIVGGRATIEGEPLSVAVDLAIDSELFQWALRTKPGRIIYYSSSAISVNLASSSEFFFSLSNESFETSTFIFFLDFLTAFAEAADGSTDTSDNADDGSTIDDTFIVGFFPFTLSFRFTFV